MPEAAPQPSASATTLPAWARRWILEAEGGLSNDASDPGGLTKYGISKRAHPEVDIQSLTEDGAAAIYAAEYWAPIHGDDLPPPFALVVFDAAVLQGVGTAVKTLQRALISLGYDEVTADGVVGQQTLHAAIVAWTRQPNAALAHLLALRMLALVELVEAAPKLRKFLLGWTRRLFKLDAVAAGLSA